MFVSTFFGNRHVTCLCPCPWPHPYSRPCFLVEEYRGLHKKSTVFMVDLEKAYDYMDWGFWILCWKGRALGLGGGGGFGSVSSCNMSVIVNGKVGNSFRSL